MDGSTPTARTVCVLGNSHLAALKVAWDGVDAQARPMTLEFFGSKSQSLARTFVEDSVLKSDDAGVRRSLENTGGSSEIRLADYDAFLIVGGGVQFRLVGRMLAGVSVHPEGVGDGRLASKAMLREIALHQVRQTAAWELASMIAPASRSPIYVVPEPFIAKIGLTSDTMTFMIPVLSRGPEFMRASAEIFDAACAKAFAGLAEVIRQPDETREDFVFTKEAYSFGAVALKKLVKDRQAKEGDYVHKNADYGGTILRSFFAREGAGSAALP